MAVKDLDIYSPFHSTDDPLNFALIADYVVFKSIWILE